MRKSVRTCVCVCVEEEVVRSILVKIFIKQSNKHKLNDPPEELWVDVWWIYCSHRVYGQHWQKHCSNHLYIF